MAAERWNDEPRKWYFQRIGTPVRRSLCSGLDITQEVAVAHVKTESAFCKQTLILWMECVDGLTPVALYRKGKEAATVREHIYRNAADTVRKAAKWAQVAP